MFAGRLVHSLALRSELRGVCARLQEQGWVETALDSKTQSTSVRRNQLCENIPFLSEGQRKTACKEEKSEESRLTAFKTSPLHQRLYSQLGNRTVEQRYPHKLREPWKRFKAEYRLPQYVCPEHYYRNMVAYGYHESGVHYLTRSTSKPATAMYNSERRAQISP